MDKKVLWAVLVLLGIVVVFAVLNAGEHEERLASQRERKVFIDFGEERITVNYDDILTLEQHEFEETLRSSEAPPRDKVFKGVRMQDLLDSVDIPAEEINQVITKSVDAYTVALSQEEVLSEDNVYVIHEIDGETLISREEGGWGPFMIVIREETFAQRWNRYLMEIEVR